LWAVMLVIALVALGWLVVNLYPGIWQEISRKRVATLIGIVVALTVIIVLLALGGASLGWTGFSEKTLWDWLQLLSALAIPVVLAAAGLWFTVQQDARQQKIENQRAEAERELAEQRAQDEALQAYLNQMSQLILDRKLLEAEQGTALYTLAQARTSTVILRLDAEHNESVTRFLINSGLAVRSDSGFAVEYLRYPLPGVPVRSEASARLLSRIALPHATLSGTHLLNADLIVADLTGADLSDANLEGAGLSGADLSVADLSDAYLRYADLSKTNLRGAQGISNEELDQQAETLEGATMPNGQKY
jgi:hypothetical protein